MKKREFAYGRFKNVILTSVGFIGLFLFVLMCEKFEPESVLILHTDTITDYSHNQFLAKGMISNIGGEDIVQHGFCWSRFTNPSLDNNPKIQLGARDSAGRFSHLVTGLDVNTTYYVRAFASNQKETRYGEERSFTTKKAPAVPTIATTSVFSITDSSAYSGGHVSDDGGDMVSARGVCWSTNPLPTLSDKHTAEGTGVGFFSSFLSDLNCQTTYYVRAYATNSVGTGYGTEESFITSKCQGVLPTVTTSQITGITESSAQGGGEVTDTGGSAIIEIGVCWSTSPSPTISDNHTSDGTGTGSFTSSISGLECGTTYFVRAFATNSAGTSYGSTLSFTTSDCTGGIPTVSTAEITGITEFEARGGGNVTDDGGFDITARGVCWSTSQNPTVGGSHTVDGTGTGVFTSSLTDLTCGTTYYVRAYATNTEGTAYGTQEIFSTTPCTVNLPTVTTATISNITESSAQGGGDVTDEGQAKVTSKGVCWSTSPEPTIADNFTTDGIGTGSFISSLTGLACGTTYYVRAYATNTKGTAYGTQEIFTTTPCAVNLPTVTTATISNITETSAQGGGFVTDDGGGTVTARGVCWSITPEPTLADNYTTDGAGTGIFISTIEGLECNTTYYVKAYATNSAGTAYGSQVDFITGACPPVQPTVTTSAIEGITAFTALGGGDVTDDGGGQVTARGVCWSTSSNPTISDNYTDDGTGTGSFSSSLTGLAPLTTYYVRAYATNTAGTGYGREEKFTTLKSPGIVVTDIDGNIYPAVQIGEQVWMAANLRVTRYADGTEIPLWSLLNNARAYTYYDNEPSNAVPYGALYTWTAATDGVASRDNPSGVQGVCPDGWHIPADEEWQELEQFLGMSDSQLDKKGDWRGTDEGGKLKEEGTLHWNDPNAGATNSSGFTALPGGTMSRYGVFSPLGESAYYWTCRQDKTKAYYRLLSNQRDDIYRNTESKNNLYSVRCVMD